MRWGVLVLVGLGGCSVFLDGDNQQPTADAGLDPDASDDAPMFQPFGELPALAVDDLPAVDWSPAPGCRITTGPTPSDECASAGQVEGDLFVVRARDVTMSGVVEVRGTRPMAIVARTITIRSGGSLDAGSRAGSLEGGGGHGACATPAQRGFSKGGGGGGGFAGGGGDGGDRSTSSGTGGPPIDQPLVLRGGCDGGNTSGVGNDRLGGRGGGGVQLTGLVRVLVDGEIDVSGAGGQGGDVAGGGGGGSGGMVVLDSPMIVNRGIVHLGGGGGGAGGSASSAGQDGSQGGGGGANTMFGAGGDGGVAGEVDGGNGQADLDASGGGGGGAGYLVTSDPTI